MCVCGKNSHYGGATNNVCVCGKNSHYGGATNNVCVCVVLGTSRLTSLNTLTLK